MHGASTGGRCSCNSRTVDKLNNFTQDDLGYFGGTDDGCEKERLNLQ